MLTITQFEDAITTLENAANAADRAGDRYIFERLWDQRDALVAATTHLVPRNPEEVIVLQNLIEEYVDFVEDDPTREGDKDDAIAAVRRMTERIRDYAIGA